MAKSKNPPQSYEPLFKKGSILNPIKKVSKTTENGLSVVKKEKRYTNPITGAEVLKTKTKIGPTKQKNTQIVRKNQISDAQVKINISKASGSRKRRNVQRTVK